jgi:hypothetical protein
LPRTCRSISPCFTVSIHSVDRSMEGAAGRSRARPTVVTTSNSAMAMIHGVRFTFGFWRGISMGSDQLE